MKNSILISEVSPEQLKDMLKEALREILHENGSLPKQEEDGLLTSEEMMKMFGITKITLYLWRKKKLMPYHRIARKIYYKKSEVSEALKFLPNYKGRRKS